MAGYVPFSSSGGIMDPNSPDFVNPGGTGPGLQTGGLSFGNMSTYGKLGVVAQGAEAFSSLAEIYAGFKAMKLAKDQFKFQKDAWTKNYNNQVKDYQNTLRDRWAVEAYSSAARGRDFGSMASYVNPRALTGQATPQIQPRPQQQQLPPPQGG